MAQKLRDAGAIILGMSNLSEFANARYDNSGSGWSPRGGQCFGALAIISSVDAALPVYPPDIVLYDDMQRIWPRVRFGEDDFVFCHNNLSAHNIVVDPETFKTIVILDWEYSERPLWRERYTEWSEKDGKRYVEEVKNFFIQGAM